jgi:hypothetical protein
MSYFNDPIPSVRKYTLHKMYSSQNTQSGSQYPTVHPGGVVRPEKENSLLFPVLDKKFPVFEFHRVYDNELEIKG